VDYIEDTVTQGVNRCLNVIEGIPSGEQYDYRATTAVLELKQLTATDNTITGIGQQFSAGVTVVSQKTIERIQRLLNINTHVDEEGNIKPATALRIGSLTLISQDLSPNARIAAQEHENVHIAVAAVHENPDTRHIVDNAADAVISSGAVAALAEACKARERKKTSAGVYKETKHDYAVFILNEALAIIDELECLLRIDKDNMSPQEQDAINATLTTLRNKLSMTEQPVTLLNSDGTPWLNEDGDPITATCYYSIDTQIAALQQAMWRVLRENQVFTGTALEDMAAQHSDMYGRKRGPLNDNERLLYTKLYDLFTSENVNIGKGDAELIVTSLCKYNEGDLQFLVDKQILLPEEKNAVVQNNINFDYTASRDSSDKNLPQRLKELVDYYNSNITEDDGIADPQTIKLKLIKMLFPTTEYERLLGDGHSTSRIAWVGEKVAVTRAINFLDNEQSILKATEDMRLFPAGVAKEIMSSHILNLDTTEKAETIFAKYNMAIQEFLDLGCSRSFAYHLVRRKGIAETLDIAEKIAALIERGKIETDKTSRTKWERVCLYKGYEGVIDFIKKGENITPQLEKMGFTSSEAKQLFYLRSSNIVNDLQKYEITQPDGTKKSLFAQLMDYVDRGTAISILLYNKFDKALSIAKKKGSTKLALMKIFSSYQNCEHIVNRLLLLLSSDEALAVAPGVKEEMDRIHTDYGYSILSELAYFVIAYGKGYSYELAGEHRTTITDIMACGFTETLALRIFMKYEDGVEALKFAQFVNTVISGNTKTKGLMDMGFRAYRGTPSDMHHFCGTRTKEELMALYIKVKVHYIMNGCVGEPIMLKVSRDIDSELVPFYEGQEEDFAEIEGLPPKDNQGIQKGRGNIGEDRLREVCTGGKYPTTTIYDRGNSVTTQNEKYTNLVSQTILKLRAFGYHDAALALENSKVVLVDVYDEEGRRVPGLIIDDKYNYSFGFSDRLTDTIYISKQHIDNLLKDGMNLAAIASIAHEGVELREVHIFDGNAFDGKNTLAEELANKAEAEIAGLSLSDNFDNVSFLDDYIEMEVEDYLMQKGGPYLLGYEEDGYKVSAFDPVLDWKRNTRASSGCSRQLFK
jgi:hypothetical protein